MGKFENILITGGAGYVGAVLIPKLINKAYNVKVVDLYIYGEDVLDSVKDNPALTQIKGDIRDRELMDKVLENVDAVIHLACISNDPSYELDPGLGKSINYDAFTQLVELSKKHKIKRFIYASSSSVYGVKEEKDVTENLPLEPLTDYSKYKAKCEEYILKEITDEFTVSIIRPATVCGYSPRQRLDLTVNILTNHAVNKGEITVFGGDQMRPNIHIEDMTDLYLLLLELPSEKLHRKIFNAGYENHTVNDIAGMVKNIINENIQIKKIPTDDNRSYHISSDKIKNELGFVPRRTVEDAISDLKCAFVKGKFEDPMNNKRYYNIKTMQAVKLR